MTRIIGGVLGSLRLKGPAKATRPTSDRVKESIFSILESRGAIQDARVLDLFAGTGALGLEAASRGARSVTFVEEDGAAVKVCGANVAQVRAGLLNVGKSCSFTLVKSRAVSFLKKGEAFDLVFVDPPYNFLNSEISRLLAYLRLNSGGVLIIERSARSQSLNPDGFTLSQEKSYGDTSVAFFEVKTEADHQSRLSSGSE